MIHSVYVAICTFAFILRCSSDVNVFGGQLYKRRSSFSNKYTSRYHRESIHKGEFDNVEIDVLAQRIIGDDTIEMDMGRKPSIPSYSYLLYTAMEEVAMRSEVASENELTTIRTIKPYIMSSFIGKPSRLLLFKLTKFYKTKSRLEIVLNLGNIGNTLDNEMEFSIRVSSSKKGWAHFNGELYNNFLIFDISSLHQDLQPSLKVHRMFQMGEQHRRISHHMEPILVIFENHVNNPLYLQSSRSKRNVPEVQQNMDEGHSQHLSSFVESETRAESGIDLYHCRKHDWTIDMRIFNWNWYAFPVNLNAGFCSGHCPFPLDVEVLNSTNHSFLKNRWRIETYGLDDNVPTECCTPISYLPAVIIYFSSSLQYVMKELPNMKVESCGCR